MNETYGRCVTDCELAACMAQEARLREDPFVRRFAESRRKLAADPYRPDSVGVSLRAQGADAELLSLHAWPLRGIHEEPGASH